LSSYGYQNEEGTLKLLSTCFIHISQYVYNLDMRALSNDRGVRAA